MQSMGHRVSVGQMRKFRRRWWGWLCNSVSVLHATALHVTHDAGGNSYVMCILPQ